MELSDLLRAHGQVLAAQRNLNACAVQYRDLAAAVEDITARFNKVKAEVESGTGQVYDENKMELVDRPKPVEKSE